MACRYGLTPATRHTCDGQGGSSHNLLISRPICDSLRPGGCISWPFFWTSTGEPRPRNAKPAG